MDVDTWADMQQYNPEKWHIPDAEIASLVFAISEEPFSSLLFENIDSAFMKAFGVTIKLSIPDRKGSFFGTITDIRDNDNNTVDVQMEFEGETQMDTTWYPLLNPPLWYNQSQYVSRRAMMIDGVVLGIFTYVSSPG